jgi:hypothetical protein
MYTFIHFTWGGRLVGDWEVIEELEKEKEEEEEEEEERSSLTSPGPVTSSVTSSVSSTDHDAAAAPAQPPAREVRGGGRKVGLLAIWAAAMRDPHVQRQGDGRGGGEGERGGDAFGFATGGVGSGCGREGEASPRQGGDTWPDATLCDTLASTLATKHSRLMFG